MGAREAPKRRIDPPKRASGVGSATQSDDEVDAVHLHAGWGLGQPLELDIAQGDVHERARVHVVEVVVRSGVRVEPAAIAIHRELANQAGGREQVERVVDRGLRYPQAEPTQAGKDLFGGEMLGAPEEQRGNAQPLRGGSYAVTQEALGQVLD